jgi:hypothetical protein
MKVMSAPQYGQKTSNNNQGYSPIGNAFQIIVDKIDNQKVAYPAFNEKLRAHKLIPEPSSWKQKMTSGVWGTMPMPANPKVADADLHTIVKWVLSH